MCYIYLKSKSFNHTLVFYLSRVVESQPHPCVLLIQSRSLNHTHELVWGLDCRPETTQYNGRDIGCRPGTTRVLADTWTADLKPPRVRFEAWSADLREPCVLVGACISHQVQTRVLVVSRPGSHTKYKPVYWSMSGPQT